MIDKVWWTRYDIQ